MVETPKRSTRARARRRWPWLLSALGAVAAAAAVLAPPRPISPPPAPRPPRVQDRRRPGEVSTELPDEDSAEVTTPER